MLRVPKFDIWNERDSPYEKVSIRTDAQEVEAIAQLYPWTKGWCSATQPLS